MEQKHSGDLSLSEALISSGNHEEFGSDAVFEELCRNKVEEIKCHHLVTVGSFLALSEKWKSEKTGVKCSLMHIPKPLGGGNFLLIS